MDFVKDQYSKDISESCFKLDSNIEKQTNLEIDLLKLQSKLDEAYLEIKELKKFNSAETNLSDLLKRDLTDKEIQLNSLQELYQKISNENLYLITLNTNEKNKYKAKYYNLHSKVLFLILKIFYILNNL